MADNFEVHAMRADNVRLLLMIKLSQGKFKAIQY